MHHERLRRYGATATTIAALGGIGVTAAEAGPGHPTSALGAEKTKMPKSVPDGVKSLASFEAIQRDRNNCLRRMNKRWNGVLVLHAPRKESALVSFATSPRSYAPEAGPFSVMTGKYDKLINIVVPNPAVVECDGRDMAVIYDVENGGNFGFLDIKFAEEVGALDSYAYKGVRPKAQHHTYSSETNDLPIAYSSEHYSPSWKGADGHQVLTSIYLPTNLDPHKKLYKLTPSSVVPHA
ncbi:hypothetical protein KW792_01710 [Candidatus Saccharibacteria bacterium]|nr:hypothetical protein [Candidatus Saccharibacteria bacterium]